ncbi:hypothetical protein CIT292_09637 [Citrobacter youngae ATCC 29220]|uniref:Uncharacterized protein n=1 Tax=Citrobacter youngae ATCC 29220 TaxID=500640 RepID=D4BGI9_9ENTR|nr:hypothetical protein CIT292_09637 [Citrobacter youngae ATCC 29220]
MNLCEYGELFHLACRQQKIANRASFFAAWRVLFCDGFQRRGGNSMNCAKRMLAGYGVTPPSGTQLQYV